MKTQEELSEYVHKKLKRGYPEGELCNDLLNEGYTDEQVQKAIYDPPADPEERKRLEQKKIDSNPFWYLTSISFIVLGIALRSPLMESWSNTMIVLGCIGLLAKVLFPMFEKMKPK